MLITKKLSEALNAAREEYKDLTTRIEFERAEYEAEIESVQDDARNKDDNIIVSFSTFKLLLSYFFCCKMRCIWGFSKFQILLWTSWQ